jgi:2-aminophenol/2-amino-5-chlorophenol 1,6-dioxygenase beta subunit
MKGSIIAGILAPHPPHLVYADAAPQNEVHGSCGWESLRWGYAACREKLAALKPEVLLVHSPHWQTIVGHHVIAVDRLKGLAVDPIFPHIFRYHYDVQIEVPLAKSIAEEAAAEGLETALMTNPDFCVDYGSVTSLHMVNPQWNLPVVVLSANNSPYYFSTTKGLQEMMKLGEATRRAIEKSGKRCVLLASNSLSHRHFTEEPAVIEDMAAEHIYHHSHYQWDMRVLRLMQEGRSKEVLDLLPEYIDATAAEVKAGALSWMLSAMGLPTYPAEVHGYGTVIGTGNAVVGWYQQSAERGGSL